MERFCIITNLEKDPEYKMAESIRHYLKEHNKQCTIIKDRFVDNNNVSYPDAGQIPEDVECLIVLGGDGTMIRAANDFHEKQIPLLGVNMGTLGYLTEIEKQDISYALEQLFCDDYKIEKRLMLQGTLFSGIDRQYAGTALNDFVISKTGVSRLITVHVYVNEEYIDTYVADGMILSTPTGSTGYNLSAGGPVIGPEVRAIVLTPICPHSLNKRSLVVSASDSIRLRIGKSKDHSEDKAIIISDGRIAGELQTEDEIIITKSAIDTQIVKVTEQGFFQRVREKLNREK